MTTAKIIALSFAALLFGAAALADNFVKRPWPIIDASALVPPKQFDHDFPGTIRIIRTTEAVIREKCAGQIKGSRALGCTTFFVGNNDICNVYIVNDETLEALGWDYDLVYRHERAHCNGWRHD